MLKFLSLQNKYFWVFILSFFYIVANAIFCYNEIYYFNLLPVIIILAYLAITRLDTFILLIVFFVPLSISIDEIIPGLNFNIFIPTEPAIFGVLVLFIIKLFLNQKIDKKILYHPMSIAIYINLFWIFITCITSTMPVVSFKFFLSRLWFVAAFYFIATQLFTKISNIKKFLWIYIFALLIVICYTVIHHLSFGLDDKKASNFVMQPFYNDHTAYGALLAMYIPVLIALVKIKKQNLTTSVFSGLLIIIYFIALILSYSRAAWISIVLALGVLLIFYFRIKFIYVFMGIGIVGAFYLANREAITLKLEKNRQDSSVKLSEQVKSISNISTDASNLERINRWDCAIKMFKEKPVFGWGPGTYMFKYAPFQKSKDLTIISTYAANRGNAHSEYIGPLAESGLFGSLSFILIAFISIITAIRIYFKSKNKEIRILALSVLLGLITYYIHGTLNNFLDTDKASVPFWGFIAILVALDVYHRNKE